MNQEVKLQEMWKTFVSDVEESDPRSASAAQIVENQAVYFSMMPSADVDLCNMLLKGDWRDCVYGAIERNCYESTTLDLCSVQPPTDPVSMVVCLKASKTGAATIPEFNLCTKPVTAKLERLAAKKVTSKAQLVKAVDHLFAFAKDEVVRAYLRIHTYKGHTPVYANGLGDLEAAIERASDEVRAASFRGKPNRIVCHPSLRTISYVANLKIPGYTWATSGALRRGDVLLVRAGNSVFDSAVVWAPHSLPVRMSRGMTKITKKRKLDVMLRHSVTALDKSPLASSRLIAVVGM